MTAAGRYRIAAVAEMTGVPEASLRAWERRYGVPTPERTSSGYRVYSHQEVEIVRRMRELCDAGMAPGEAAQLLRGGGGGAAVAEVASLEVDPFERASKRIVDAAKRMDPAALEEEVRFATALADATTIVERVFCPAMAAIGREWERGHLSVGHEHLASEHVVQVVRELLRLLGPARPLGEVLLACFAEEEHVLPLYSAAFRFVEWGYRPRLLGARTPPAALGAAVRELEPACVGLSATIAPPLGRAEELIAAYADVIGDVPWVVGGAAACELQALVEQHGGHVIHGHGSEARAILGQLLLKPRG